jgi:hypothetical protein
MQTNSINDPLTSLFSPSSITFNLSSPLTTLVNPNSTQDISYLSPLPPTNNSSIDNSFTQSTFPQ